MILTYRRSTQAQSALTLFDELQALGSIPGHVRRCSARSAPVAPPGLSNRSGATAQVNVIVEQLPGGDTQWTWLDWRSRSTSTRSAPSDTQLGCWRSTAA